jgi:carbamoyl-phosphate synthase small subunit
MEPKLIFGDTVLKGESFGAPVSVSGEVVFTTGMSGYVEALTDPSYRGQILVFTYPLLGSYGVPERSSWESGRIQAAGLIVSDHIDTPSHAESLQSLEEWLKEEGVPALIIKDTRAIIQKIRTEGSPLGKIVNGKDVPIEDPNERNLVAEVSTTAISEFGKGKKKIVLIDCGAKGNIERELVKRGVTVTTVPWNLNIFEYGLKFDGIVVSNGPGNPKKVKDTIDIVREALRLKVPLLGICLGNQILALAAGGDTYKLKFGHRGQNQPCILSHGERAYLTTQNHGYAVRTLPKGFKEWFTNANDGTNEGLIHTSLPFMSVQFHPEANPGPTDTSWVFDHFLACI